MEKVGGEDYPWIIHGIFLDNPWMINELSMDYPRIIHGPWIIHR